MYAPKLGKYVIKKDLDLEKAEVKPAKEVKAKTKKVGLVGKVINDYDDKGSEVGHRPRDMKKKIKRVISRAAKAPKEYKKEGGTKRSQYADQENFKYPIFEAEKVRAALSYFSQHGSDYSPDKRKVVAKRIYDAAKKFGINVSEEWLKKFNLKKGLGTMSAEKFEEMMIQKGMAYGYSDPVEHKGDSSPSRVKSKDEEKKDSSMEKGEGYDEFKRVDRGKKGVIARDKGEEEVYGAGVAAGERMEKKKLKKGFFEDRDFVNLGSATIETPWGKQETGVLLNQEGSAWGKALIMTPDGKRLVDVNITSILEKAQKEQGYDDREDESMGMRDGKEKDKKQDMKARRDDSYGKWGKRDEEDRKIAKAKKEQGYDDREDESLGMRDGKEKDKKQDMKARRDDSYGKWGKRDEEDRKVSKSKKEQGYDDREDESLGMRTGKEKDKKQDMKARREDSYGKWGKRDEEKRKVSKSNSLIKSVDFMHGISDAQISNTVGSLNEIPNQTADRPWSYDPSQVRVTEQLFSKGNQDINALDPAVLGRFDASQRPDDGFAYMNSSDYFLVNESNDKDMTAKMHAELGINEKDNFYLKF